MFLPILIIVILIDVYVFNAISALPMGGHQAVYFSVYWTTVILTLVGMSAFFRNVRKGLNQMKPSTNLLFGLAFSLILAKLFYSIFLLGEDVFRLAYYSVKLVVSDGPVTYAARNSYVSWAGIGFSAIPFLAMSYGVISGKYRYTTRVIQLKLDGLPKAFHGFRVVQFSDAHLGSFDSIKGLRKGIQAIQNAQPDVILFTGDMVNNVSAEAQPYIDEFKALEAPMGKFSILGNHDYGEYVRWPSREAKQVNLSNLKRIQSEMGFDMLHNRHVMLEKNGEKICLAGVENWGKPPFPQHGDLSKALAGVPQEMITILMSHDPSHWDLPVKQHPKPVHLTLSGHTHGMQFGIDLPFFKWSPVKWKYPKWAGFYEEAGKFLYVNRGFGFIGFPGRAGIWPEITVIELGCK